MLFESLNSTIEILALTFLCLVIANAIIFGVMMYIFTIFETVASIKFNRRIAYHVDQHFEDQKQITNEPDSKTADGKTEVVR